MKITWGGHATTLIEIGNHRIITDPNLVRRLFLFKRQNEPGLSSDQLQTVTHIILSHGHLDHTDKATLRRIPRTAHAIARGRITDIPSSLKFNTTSLEPGESISQNSLRVTCLPAQHFGGRWQINGDFRKYHFASYMIQSEGKTIYFAGDTGYGAHFREIAKRFPNIDVAILPIGAYEPRKMLRHNHVSPEEAVQAFLDLRAKAFIPIHWGTFKLAREPIDEPPKLLQAAAEKNNISNLIHLLGPGESFAA